MCRYSGFIFKNDAPVLNRKNANKAIFALKMLNNHYMDYGTCNKNHKTVEYHIGQLANDLNNATSVNYKLLENVLKQINKIEHTRASSKTQKDIAKYISGLNISVFINYLQNENMQYDLTSLLLNHATTKSLSLISKFCFHLANAYFKTDCGYSKFDNIVSTKLHKYNYLLKNKITKNEFASRTVITYRKYCEVIGELCKKTKLSRNEIDQIIWIYFRQL